MLETDLETSSLHLTLVQLRGGTDMPLASAVAAHRQGEDAGQSPWLVPTLGARGYR